MASVHLVFIPPDQPRSPGEPPPPDGTLPLRESQGVDPFGAHTITEDPAAAGIILFVRTLSHDGAVFSRLRVHPLVRRFRARCFLYDVNDRIVPVLPGIFPSVERRWHSRARTRGGPYVPEGEENPFLVYDPADTERRYLYSFLGGVASAPVRAALARIPHPRGYFLDTTEENDRVMRHGTAEERRAFARQYADATRLSRFVLCPRGMGLSSRRLFETMRMGRAPVVLADGWVPPDGPAWERSCVFVPEADHASLPRLLEAREADAPAMGQEARRQWEEWFSPPVLFHRAVESCLSIARERHLPEPLASWLAYGQMLRPSLLRHWARQTGFNQRMKARLRGR